MKTKLLKLNEVIFDKSIYPRNAVDWQTSARYYNALKSGAIFPPICTALFKGKYILVDGGHRLKAFKDNKEEYIKAEILKGLNKQEMYIEAIKRNVINGRQFSTQEITQVALTLEKWNISQEQISEIIRIPVEHLKPFIAKRITRITETEENLVLKNPFAHLSGIEIPSAWEIGKIQKSFDGSSQIQLLDELIKLIENRLFDLNNPVISKKFKKLQELIKNYILM